MTVLLFSGQARAQESSSRPDDTAQGRGTGPNLPPNANASTIAAGPSAALRDVLLAACSQDGGGFSRFLTARSKQSFDRLTPAARVALMKRFVLLNVPGKASASANPAGRPMVHCETPDVTTEMSIGGADVRDNVAFMPMELRDANDSTNVSVHQVNMGMVREDGQWRLLSLGLLLLDLPALEVEWDSAEADANESTALDNLKTLADAVEAYRRTYSSLPESLTNLGPAPAAAATKTGAAKNAPAIAAATHEAAGLVAADLASGSKDGYVFRIVIAGDSALGAPAKYELAATPSAYGRTGKKSFFRDIDGVFHAGDHQGAVGGKSDPRIQ
ncbi:MAG: hypothetical protein M3P45_04000 [Acidobacteriota bacterium]|nr:hypothetical protein [Acidobacteriota bacterium]